MVPALAGECARSDSGPVRQSRRIALLLACEGEASEMQLRKKPDLLWVLVCLFGLGVVTTSYAQSLWWP
ncbi:hypothetical protein OF001_U270035 [Pseudomonas sp. OF001]|jgi:hypothetical protein|nr:hypothetical protein OF001_U270035 [Pseudomonas sp. OF001]